MQTLLTVIVSWLAINFGLPATYEHPRVEFASAAEMEKVRQVRLAAEQPDVIKPEPGGPGPREIHNVHAIYDDHGRIIYLPEGWTGETPAEVAVLVHELVHHLQNVANLNYACPQAREKPAYQAQAAWLELFGTSLVEEFELDPMTLLVRTNCLH